MLVGGVDEEEGMMDALESSTVIALRIESADDARAISTPGRTSGMALMLLKKVERLLHVSERWLSRVVLQVEVALNPPKQPQGFVTA